MMGFHLIIIIQSLLSGMPKQHITYSKNHYNFNMHSHRLIVSFHYVMVVFFIIYLNAFEYGIFPFSLILFNLINGMTIIILSRVILVLNARFYHTYRLICEYPDHARTEILV